MPSGAEEAGDRRPENGLDGKRREGSSSPWAEGISRYFEASVLRRLMSVLLWTQARDSILVFDLVTPDIATLTASIRLRAALGMSDSAGIGCSRQQRP
jgi:hypothetical protein